VLTSVELHLLTIAKDLSYNTMLLRASRSHQFSLKEEGGGGEVTDRD